MTTKTMCASAGAVPQFSAQAAQQAIQNGLSQSQLQGYAKQYQQSVGSLQQGGLNSVFATWQDFVPDDESMQWVSLKTTMYMQMVVQIGHLQGCLFL